MQESDTQGGVEHGAAHRRREGVRRLSLLALQAVGSVKLTSGVRLRERQQRALDRLITRYQTEIERQAESPKLTRMASEIETLKRKIGA